MSLLSKFPSKEYKTIYEYLHDYTGCSRKQKLADDLSDFLYFEKLGWANRNRKHMSPEVCLITVTEPGTGEILDLGGSLPGDLFVDNWGSLWASLIRQPSTSVGVLTSILKDTGGATRTFNMIGNSATLFNAGGAVVNGTRMQIGSSTTAPARADTGVTTAFSTAPESAAFDTGAGSYTNGTGTITVSGSITAGNESATINEALFMGSYQDSSSTLRLIATCHDATTATAFSNAKSITLQYSISD